MSPAAEQYFGKYRGTVIDNVDPMQIGRILVEVPDVSGVLPSSWAMPCVPVAGINTGILSVPPIGSGVWIEFEQGDPDYPIWVGGFWGSAAELPALGHEVVPPIGGITLQTPLANGIVISDLPGAGGIQLMTATGASILITETGIVISNGQGAVISMVGPTVDINAGAMTVV